MIAGLGISASGVASAIRTALKARATMDDMTRQIATGQRVASVKDDGAAWARAAAMRSDQARNDARRFGLDRVESGLAFTEAAFERARQTFEQFKDIAIRARQFQAGSVQRQALAAEWQALVASRFDGVQENPAFPSHTGYGVDGYELSADDPLFAGTRWQIYPTTNFLNGWMNAVSAPDIPVMLSTVNIVTASDSILADAIQSADWIAGNQQATYSSAWLAKVGHDQNTLERVRAVVEAEAARLDGAMGSLTDADLGKASSARAQAETRQQLALSTVRQAISTYGNMASGLLGNVQRTQRGVMA